MTDEQDKDTSASDETAEAERKSITSPPGGKTHEATTPPGQGERDERASQEAEDKLDQAAGGY
jgi:hypothetical protein